MFITQQLNHQLGWVAGGSFIREVWRTLWCFLSWHPCCFWPARVKSSALIRVRKLLPCQVGCELRAYWLSCGKCYYITKTVNCLYFGWRGEIVQELLGSISVQPGSQATSFLDERGNSCWMQKCLIVIHTWYSAWIKSMDSRENVSLLLSLFFLFFFQSNSHPSIQMTWKGSRDSPGPCFDPIETHPSEAVVVGSYRWLFPCCMPGMSFRLRHPEEVS